MSGARLALMRSPSLIRWSSPGTTQGWIEVRSGLMYEQRARRVSGGLSPEAAGAVAALLQYQKPIDPRHGCGL